MQDNSEWVTKKTLVCLDYTVNFDWEMLPVCKDGVLIDSVHRSNRITAYENDSIFESFIIPVTTEMGNHYYKLIKSISEFNLPAKEVLQDLYLKATALAGSYIDYSNAYKLIYGYRPYFTENDWDTFVNELRKVGSK